MTVIGSGKTSPKRLSVAIRRAAVMKARIDGMTIPQIRDVYGYRSTSAVYQDISRALAEQVGAPAAEVRALEVARLDAALERLNERETHVIEVRDRKHLTVSHGRIIMVGVGDEVVPLIDDEPVLRATAQLLAIEGRRLDIQTRRAKLLGLDAPNKVSVITDEALAEEYDKESAAIAELERQIGDLEFEASPDDGGPEGGEEETS